MSNCVYLEVCLESKIDNTGTTSKRNYFCLYRNKGVDPSVSCNDCKYYFNRLGFDDFGNKKEIPTASKCRSDYEEGYAKGFADGYERALKNTPTFPIISTSPARIVPDQLQGWRYEENDN